MNIRTLKMSCSCAVFSSIPTNAFIPSWLYLVVCLAFPSAIAKANSDNADQ